MEKPDFEQIASFRSDIADHSMFLGFKSGCEHVWNTHVVPLQEKNKALKIDASNWAYQCDRAKQDRDKAEFENQALREKIERLKAELPLTKSLLGDV